MKKLKRTFLPAAVGRRLVAAAVLIGLSAAAARAQQMVLEGF